jgi:hypothetical protein
MIQRMSSFGVTMQPLHFAGQLIALAREMSSMMFRWPSAAFVALACGLPRDADGALGNIRNGTLRVGVARIADASRTLGRIDWRIYNLTVMPVLALTDDAVPKVAGGG